MPSAGALSGKGWEWVAGGYLLGGLWLVQQRIITWQIPFAFLAALGLMSGVFSAIDAQRYAGPMFHLLGGGAMLGAFFTGMWVGSSHDGTILPLAAISATVSVCLFISARVLARHGRTA